ncbi:MAG: T9SS type A sorting domain-containing protein [Bacteroidia bacterium]|nr:T9SS type A sorting domain-containing protein [Bacteroidia bacterium]MBP6648183.1 T9SS type A sorting domain-containing protein [Bacteroidia bacterium]
MKKILLLVNLAVFLFVVQINAQTVTVSGDISTNTTWLSNTTYLLSGFVYVTNNAELTIQPGTIIKGDKASKGSLIITRGSKIFADGTPSQPIVFTSNEPAGSRTYGDWGGLVICGNAPINDPAGEKVIEGGVDPVKGLYGGSNSSDNSGILRYVRIEFPGIAFMPNNEINGLTMGGVGSGTTIDYIQVSYSGDDSYESFGGNVNLKHLIAYRGLDDDFDTDYGFSGRCQFLVSLRDSNVADISGSNGFESDNDATGSLNTPTTHPIYSNVTELGPMVNAGTQINSNFKRGAHIRRSAKTSIYNSVIAGYPTGLLVDGTNCESNANNDELQFRNNVLAGCTTPLAVASGSTFDITTWFNMPVFANSILPNTSDLNLTDAYNYDAPDFMPLNTSPLLSGADFSASNLLDPFFEDVTFRGAFGATDWTSGWTNFDCQNTDYTTGIKENEAVESAILFPNPIDASSQLSFELVNASTIDLNIMDISGKVVSSTVYTNLSAGHHRVLLTEKSIVAGIYTLQIKSAFGTSVRKLIVR